MIHPIDNICWVSRDSIKPNDYNPNAQPPPEFRLLKISIMEDGFTQPIVVHRPTKIIVDGEHRWQISDDPDVRKLTDGMVPVVFIDGDINHLMASTVRHNRARGEHGVAPMAEIVRRMIDGGMTRPQVMHLLQMESEEVDRLAERAGMPSVISREKKDFNKGWIPDR